jgi:hypothetical protein
MRALVAAWLAGLIVVLYSPAADAEIVVAVIAPETGHYSKLGTQVKAAAFRAIDDINAARKAKNLVRAGNPALRQLDLLTLQYADEKC